MIGSLTGKILQALGHNRHILKIQCADNVVKKRRLFLVWLEQRHVKLRNKDFQRQARETCSTADIQQRNIFFLFQGPAEQQ